MSSEAVGRGGETKGGKLTFGGEIGPLVPDRATSPFRN